MKHYILYLTMIGSLFSLNAEAKDIDYIAYYENGQTRMSGTLRDGLKEGKWTFWDSSGNKTEELNYKNGDKHGHATSWSYQKYIITAEYKDGLLHGEFKSENIETKEPYVYGRFENNLQEGEWYFGPNYSRKTQEFRQYKKGEQIKN